MYSPDTPESVEKYSSAVTLSDMEVFIFPELLFSLVLANIMSPVIWQWKKNPWFKDIEKMSHYRRILRVKQFIIDNFIFNLDLDTWGLTTKQEELKRFSSFIDPSVLSESNALFGYEGDKYYFDIDIRKHFGLDKYTSDVIPYWKTETVEAMDAFRFKENYHTGAGECVSFSALYTAALHIIAGIPIDKIFMIATPLHSQNFIDIKDGILTNNRRLVTKTMWFNGTELSAKARRALENEKVTFVVSNQGYIHSIFKKATMPPDAYKNFSEKLKNYLKTDISLDVITSFLRKTPELHKCFQFSRQCCGKKRFITAEKAFLYEKSSKFRIGDKSQQKLLEEIDPDEFYPEPIQGRAVLDDIELFLKKNKIRIDSSSDIEKLKTKIRHTCFNTDCFIAQLIKFCKTEPQMPFTDKDFIPYDPICIDHLNSGEEVLNHLKSIRGVNPTADLAFTAYRDMKLAPWKPFVKAAVERNPVSISGTKDLDINTVGQFLSEMPNLSIYNGSRVAQPDEVFNFKRGDGLEKAICLLNIIKSRCPDDDIKINGDKGNISVCHKNRHEFKFISGKEIGIPSEEDFVF